MEICLQQALQLVQALRLVTEIVEITLHRHQVRVVVTQVMIVAMIVVMVIAMMMIHLRVTKIIHQAHQQVLPQVEMVTKALQARLRQVVTVDLVHLRQAVELVVPRRVMMVVQEIKIPLQVHQHQVEMVTEQQAKRLADSGLYAYNHNLDTSEEYYKEIISTRGYEDRLKTLENVRKAKLTVCSGGIVGMGESVFDRCRMLETLANLDPQPESVPINALVAVEGTPLEEQQPVPIWDMVRMVATTRIVMPRTTVRLSAGRTSMSQEGQALCFMAGAGSIFAGDKLLTTPNPEVSEDMELFATLGLIPQKHYAKGEQPVVKEDNKLTDEERKERIKWSRPKHTIESNLAYTNKK